MRVLVYCNFLREVRLSGWGSEGPTLGLACYKYSGDVLLLNLFLHIFESLNREIPVHVTAADCPKKGQSKQEFI